MGSLVRVQYRPRNPRSAKVGDFFIIAAEKDGVKHDQVRPPLQAQQESPQRTGRPEAHDMGVFPGDEESREQENLQPQESRSCVEG